MEGAKAIATCAGRDRSAEMIMKRTGSGKLTLLSSCRQQTPFRYQSGFFFQHEALLPFDYYWRIEPGVKYTCDIDFDPFLYMQDNNKKYGKELYTRNLLILRFGTLDLTNVLESIRLFSPGFTISLKEYAETIPTLWNTTKDFMRKNPELLAKDNLLPFISDDDGENYNVRGR